MTRMIAEPTTTAGALYLHKVTPTGAWLSTDGGGEGSYISAETLEAASRQEDRDLAMAYGAAWAEVARAQDRHRDETSWYALVTFGSPAAHAFRDDWGRDVDSVGRGLAARAALCALADRARGTGSCSDARVVRCETEAQARAAHIGNGRLPVVYSP